jgi:hypothetical protein
MSLFGATLEGSLLQAGADVGAAVYVASPVDNASEAIAPRAAAGASISPATASSRSDPVAPQVAAGVGIEPAVANATAASNAPVISTSAQIFVSNAVETLTASSSPAAAAGTAVFPLIVTPYAREDTAGGVLGGSTLESGTLECAEESHEFILFTGSVSGSVAPTVAAGALVTPGTVNVAATSVAPVVSAGAIVLVANTIDAVSTARAPVLLGAGTNVSPIPQTTVTRSESSGSDLGGANLEFATLEGGVTTRNITIALSVQANPIAPSVFTGKNIVPFAPVDTISQARTPDIETERRRRMIQAVAA